MTNVDALFLKQSKLNKMDSLNGNYDRVIERASKEYGHFDNLIKTIEELNELSTEIAKRLLAKEENKIEDIDCNICEEIADVIICIDILSKSLDTERLKNEFHKRIARLESRLDKQLFDKQILNK